MISYAEAFELIEKEFNDLPVETEVIPIEEAGGRTTAENIFADVNLPPFDNSAIDGIAVKFNENIRSWKLNGEISAGNFRSVEIDENTALSIMTGAKIPDDCDTAIKLEDYDINGNIVTIREGIKIKKGMNIRPKASDAAIGEIVIPEKTFLCARNIAAAASCGKTEIRVLKKLKFAVLATGDELVPVNEKPEGDKIRTSNNYGLVSGVAAMNQIGVNHGVINDDYEATKNKIIEMFESDADVILTTGGVSVGKYDFVKDIFMELGVKEIFWRAYIKPGKPAFFGKFQKEGRTKLVFGLPGNPVSCLVNFEVYIKPNIIEKYGMPMQLRLRAELLNDVRKKDGKRHFVRAELMRKKNKYFVTSHVSQSSGNLAGFGRANCLIELDEDIRNPKKGDKVECILM